VRAKLAGETEVMKPSSMPLAAMARFKLSMSALVAAWPL
jgi:hypothetical protein